MHMARSSASPNVTRWLLTSLWCTAMLLAARLDAQEPPTTVMVKRFAEALDGYRTGKPLYVVLSGDPLNPPVGAFPDLRTATEFARKLGRGARVMGPGLTLSEPGDGIAACIHGGDSRWFTDRCVPPGNFTARTDIRSMTLQITRKDGSRDSIPVPVDADALFLSAAAVDKFAVPYYVRVIGLEATQAMRSAAVRGFVREARKP